jgi:branched-subunit amino acid aminotransferase/4-amino-4-deoxychorismate lyase
VDLDGSVLEGAWANVWVLRDGELLTPPDDGRLLPGVTRARLLRRPEAHESPLTLADLAGAEAIVLTSSIRLATPAGLAGPPTPRAFALAAELRSDPAVWAKSHLVHSPKTRGPRCCR